MKLSLRIAKQFKLARIFPHSVESIYSFGDGEMYFGSEDVLESESCSSLEKFLDISIGTQKAVSTYHDLFYWNPFFMVNALSKEKPSACYSVGIDRKIKVLQFRRNLMLGRGNHFI